MKVNCYKGIKVVRIIVVWGNTISKGNRVIYYSGVSYRVHGLLILVESCTFSMYEITEKER